MSHELGRGLPATANKLLSNFRRFLLVCSAAHLLKALVQRALGKKIWREIRIVGTRIVECLEHSTVIACARNLQGRRDSIQRVIVCVGSNFIDSFAAYLILCNHDEPNHQVSVPRDRDPESELTAVPQLDPVHRLEVDQIRSPVAVHHPFFIQTIAKKILRVFQQLLAKIVNLVSRLFAPPVVVHGPALVTVENVDDVSFFTEVSTVLIRVAPVLFELHVGGQIIVMAELRSPSRTLQLVNMQIGRPAHRIEHLRKDLFCFAGAGFRHHGVRILRHQARIHRGNGNQYRQSSPCKSYPQSTEPPFTLMISPVMKLARSEATNKIGPAISSAVAARPSGIAAAAIFCPALVSSTGLDMSVATHPGATGFTKIPCGASSVANPLVSEMIAPLSAP